MRISRQEHQAPWIVGAFIAALAAIVIAGLSARADDAGHGAEPPRSPGSSAAPAEAPAAKAPLPAGDTAGAVDFSKPSAHALAPVQMPSVKPTPSGEPSVVAKPTASATPLTKPSKPGSCPEKAIGQELTPAQISATEQLTRDELTQCDVLRGTSLVGRLDEYFAKSERKVPERFLPCSYYGTEVASQRVNGDWITSGCGALPDLQAHRMFRGADFTFDGTQWFRDENRKPVLASPTEIASIIHELDRGPADIAAETNPPAARKPAGRSPAQMPSFAGQAPSMIRRPQLATGAPCETDADCASGACYFEYDFVTGHKEARCGAPTDKGVKALGRACTSDRQCTLGVCGPLGFCARVPNPPVAVCGVPGEACQGELGASGNPRDGNGQSCCPGSTCLAGTCFPSKLRPENLNRKEGCTLTGQVPANSTDGRCHADEECCGGVCSSVTGVCERHAEAARCQRDVECEVSRGFACIDSRCTRATKEALAKEHREKNPASPSRGGPSWPRSPAGAPDFPQ